MFGAACARFLQIRHFLRCNYLMPFTFFVPCFVSYMRSLSFPWKTLTTSHLVRRSPLPQFPLFRSSHSPRRVAPRTDVGRPTYRACFSLRACYPPVFPTVYRPRSPQFRKLFLDDPTFSFLLRFLLACRPTCAARFSAPPATSRPSLSRLPFSVFPFDSWRPFEHCFFPQPLCLSPNFPPQLGARSYFYKYV